jgi:hypothetical protein
MDLNLNQHAKQAEQNKKAFFSCGSEMNRTSTPLFSLGRPCVTISRDRERTHTSIFSLGLQTDERATL